MKINRFQLSKSFTSGTIIVFVFYVILAIFTLGLRNTSLAGISASQILYIPILIGIVGMGWGAYNFTYDDKEPWEKGRLISFFLIGGAVILFLGQISLIIAGFDEVQKVPIRLSYFFIGNILMIISCIILAIGFVLLRKQLLGLYFKKIFIKNPNAFVVFSYILQTLAYCLFFSAYFMVNVKPEVSIMEFLQVNTGFSILQLNILIQNQVILDASGIGLIVLALIFLLVGFIPINISFRTYPHLVEDEKLRK
ncbi:MAG: hypothetical protein ACFFDS_03570 [Candidatus Thorarchaeota archaeon]